MILIIVKLRSKYKIQVKNFILPSLLVLNSICFGRIDTVKNTINNFYLPIDKNQSAFSFYVAGHVYGNPSKSIFPSMGLMNYIEKINSSDASFFILLGDNYRKADSLNITTFKHEILNKIQIPDFNAIGNHDIDNKKKQDYPTYKKHFTKNTYYSFIIKSSAFIILDTELHTKNGFTDGSITGKQLSFLKKTLNEFNALKCNVTKNVFICAHKELNLFEDNNYHKVVKPMLADLANNGVNIYILSGDMESYSTDLYMTNDEIPNITYIHTHIPDNKDDKILKFEILENGAVNIIPKSLYDFPVKSVSSFTKVRREPKPSFFSKLKYRLSNRYFYEGMLLLFICILSVKGIRKYRRNRFENDNDKSVR